MLLLNFFYHGLIMWKEALRELDDNTKYKSYFKEYMKRVFKYQIQLKKINMYIYVSSMYTNNSFKISFLIFDGAQFLSVRQCGYIQWIWTFDVYDHK